MHLLSILILLLLSLLLLYLHDLIIGRQVHLHRELKGTSFVLSVGRDCDFTATVVDDSLANGETEANSFHVDSISPLDLTKLLEKNGHISVVDAFASVDYVHDHFFLVFIVCSEDMDVTFQSELQCILCQVDENLFKSDLVT